MTDTIEYNLPTSWRGISLKKYIEISDIVIEENEDSTFDGVDNTLKVLSILTGIPTDELESMPLSEVQAMANKISFISKEPLKKTFGQAHYQVLGIEEISYDAFLQYIQLSTNPIKNLPAIIQLFLVKKKPIEIIEEIDIVDAMVILEDLKKKLQKSLKRLVRLEKKKLKEFQK